MIRLLAQHLPCVHRAKYQASWLLSIVLTLLIVMSTLKRPFSWHETLSLGRLYNSHLKIRSYQESTESESTLWNPQSLHSTLPSSLWPPGVSGTNLPCEAAAPVVTPHPHSDLTKSSLQLSSAKQASAAHRDTWFVGKMLLGNVYPVNVLKKNIFRTHRNRKFATWKH